MHFFLTERPADRKKTTAASLSGDGCQGFCFVQAKSFTMLGMMFALKAENVMISTKT